MGTTDQPVDGPVSALDRIRGLGPRPGANGAQRATQGTPSSGIGTPFDGYTRAAIANETANVAQARPGRRNWTLNTAALKLGQLELTDEYILAVLHSAASVCGLDPVEAEKTIRSGMGKGRTEPRVRAPQASPRALPALEESQNGPESAREVERTSWYPRDLTAFAAGHSEPLPTHLARSDGSNLFYAGKVNGLIGESESGKTWIALLAVAQALAAGETVLILDFEDAPTGIMSRLRSLGVTDFERLVYIDPDGPLGPLSQADLTETLDTHRPHLIILDGFNAAMTLMGLDLQSNKDATQFSQALLKPLSRTGACVVYIDHLPKSREAQGKGGIGAQAKRAMTTGCAIRVDIQAEFGRGQIGKLKLTVDKDRIGHVRGAAAGARHIGTFILDSTRGDDVRAHIEPAEQHEPGTWRPTVLIDRIAGLLAEVGTPLSGKAIETGISGKADHIRKALSLMTADGLLTRTNGPRGAILYSTSSLVPTSSHLVPDEVKRPRPSSPTLGGDEDEVESTDPDHPEPRDEVNDPRQDWYR